MSEDRIEHAILHLYSLVEKTMADLTKLTDDVTALEAAVASLKALPQPVSQADLDALATRVEAVSAEIQAMVTASSAA